MLLQDEHRKDPSNQAEIVFGLFGVGGFAREVMPLVAQSASFFNQAGARSSCRLFFVDVDPKKSVENGYPVVSEKEFFSFACDRRYFNVAIGDSSLRERISIDCVAKGAIPLSIYSPNSIMYDCNEIGEGAIICAYSIVTSNARIGKFFNSNIYSYVAHDCVIGDYVTLAPNVHCNGNVHIQNHAYIGTGAVIREGSTSNPLVIGEGAIVGMGAVVTKDVAPFTTVIGNPAQPYVK